MRRTIRGLVGGIAGAAAAAVVPWGAAEESVDGAFVDLAVAHYAQAESELAAADVSRLTPERCAARTRMLAELRAYRTSRDFGRNTDRPSERVHLFVDGDGRRCAVAQLLHRTGEDALVASVAASDNGAFVADLADEPRFREWLDRVGLTLEEAARIQGPGVPGSPTMSPPATDQPGETLGKPAGESGGGEGRGPDGGPSAGGGAPSAGGSGFGRSRAGGTADRPLGAAGADEWWLWWEMNKLTWLRPARDRLEPRTTTGHDAEEDPASLRELAVLRLLPLLDHRDAIVRKASAGAFGRLGGAFATDRLVRMLDDRNVEVRDRAILALGATADVRAARILLRIAETGAADGNGPRAPRVSPSARPLAIVALGLARRRGLEFDCGTAIADLADDATGAEEESLALAATLHHVLAPSRALAGRVEEQARDENAPPAVRGRALEALPPLGDAATVRVLQRALGARPVDVRRSAAVALGDEPNDLVAAHLMTAVEYERDALARGLAVLSIGERGGPRAESFLTGTLVGAETSLRPWAALALGLLARERPADAALEALRAAEVRANLQGSVWIGRALARDATTAAPCAAALDGTDPTVRAHAAIALGVLGGDEAAKALRRRAAVDRDDVPRVAIAHALAIRGEAADTGTLFAVARDVDAEWLRTPLAMALGVHRTRATFERLLATLAAESAPSHEVATAAEALGLAVDAVSAPSLPEVGKRTNFATVPSWLLDALRSTL